MKMKLPDVIFAIGRGLAPKRAVQLLNDEGIFEDDDIREWVGRQPNQTRRMRSRLIGTNGRISGLIEELTGTEMAIYGSTYWSLVIKNLWHLLHLQSKEFYKVQNRNCSFWFRTG